MAFISLIPFCTLCTISHIFAIQAVLRALHTLCCITEVCLGASCIAFIVKERESIDTLAASGLRFTVIAICWARTTEEPESEEGTAALGLAHTILTEKGLNASCAVRLV